MGMLVALHGAPGSGKDHFANQLSLCSSDWRRVAFAAPLKRMISVGLNIPLDDIENPTIKNSPDYKFGKSIRYMAQTLGTEWGRSLISDSIWVDLAKETIIGHLDRGCNVVITDMRFPNEVKMVRELGGHTIMINRKDNVHAAQASVHGATSHASDVTIDHSEFDFIINNISTIAEYNDQIAEVMRLL